VLEWRSAPGGRGGCPARVCWLRPGWALSCSAAWWRWRWAARSLGRCWVSLARGSRPRAEVLRSEARVGVELREQAWRERQLARALDELSAAGWRVLHDRLLPGGHHRLAHIVVGPAGVFVATPLPAGPVRLVGQPPAPGVGEARQLYVGSVHLTPWLRTRRWEVEQLEAAIAEAVEDAVWSGPTGPLAVQVPPRGGGAASGAVPDMPADWDGVTLRPVSAVAATLRGLPSPLGDGVVEELAATVDRLCPPAGSGLGQASSNKPS